MTESDQPITVKKRLDTMGKDLPALRVLYEHHDTQIQRIAEVQVEHGRSLEEHGTLLREIKGELGGIRGQLAPLREIHDFVRRVAGDHGSRISGLEKHALEQAPEARPKRCAPRGDRTGAHAEARTA